jgi:hypothetical protein
MSPACRGQRDQAVSRRRVERDRLFDDDVLTSLESRPGQLNVRGVGRADVDDIDRLIGQDRRHVARRASDAEGSRTEAELSFVGPTEGDDIRVAGPADRIHMVRADEADPNYGGSQHLAA